MHWSTIDREFKSKCRCTGLQETESKSERELDRLQVQYCKKLQNSGSFAPQGPLALSFTYFKFFFKQKFSANCLFIECILC